MTAPLNLDELERLGKAGTPGPWNPFGGWMDTDNGKDIGFFFKCADANLIAAARNALPALIARIRELEGKLEKWECDGMEGGYACGKTEQGQMVGGCGEHVSFKDSYRCADCTASFHRDCIQKHFDHPSAETKEADHA